MGRTPLTPQQMDNHPALAAAADLIATAEETGWRAGVRWRIEDNGCPYNHPLLAAAWGAGHAAGIDAAEYERQA